MKSADLPTLLASPQLATDGERFPLDRIRMQKAVFLLTQRGPEEWRTLYSYEPYNWGPYSGSLNSDLRNLIATEALSVEAVEGTSYGSYRATPKGAEEAAGILSDMPQQYQDFIKSVRHYVTSRSFSALLREVYAAYPDFAVKSKFTG